jgi:signal transduction histidine kinase
MIGKTLGHYQIVENIGPGGMGVVYKARDLHLDRFVALKVLPPEQVADQERKRRFVQEAKASSALNHSNIVHIYGIATDAGVDFIAMEYVEGPAPGHGLKECKQKIRCSKGGPTKNLKRRGIMSAPQVRFCLPKKRCAQMSSQNPGYEGLDELLAEIHRKNLENRPAKAGLAERFRDLELLILSTLQKEVLRRMEAEQSLRSMSAKLTVAEQRERQKLAGVLHDDLQQLLVAALFQIGDIYRLSERDSEQIVSVVSDLLRQAINMTRSLASELNPPVLHNADFVPALEWLKNWMKTNHGLSVESTIPDQIAFEEEEIRILLLESLRELFFNVIKHAKINIVYLAIDRLGDGFRIEVRDEGCGFDISGIESAGENPGLGLISIRERLSRLGGSMDIESSPGKGSRFTLFFPAK